MDDNSYNPIQSRQGFQTGIFMKVPYPESMEYAVVLTGGTAPAIAIWANSVPSRAAIRRGKFKEAVNVDVRSHAVSFSAELKAYGGISRFHVQVNASVRVSNPVDVVERRIEDASEALKNALTPVMDSYSTRFSVEQFQDLQSQLEINLHLAPIPGFEMGGIRVSVEPDNEYLEIARGQVREKHKSEAAANVAAYWRDDPRARAYERVLKGEITAAEAEAAGFDEELRKRLETLKTITSFRDAGDVDPEVVDAMLNNLLTTVPGTTALPEKSAQSSILLKDDKDDGDDEDDETDF